MPSSHYDLVAIQAPPHPIAKQTEAVHTLLEGPMSLSNEFKWRGNASAARLGSGSYLPVDGLVFNRVQGLIAVEIQAVLSRKFQSLLSNEFKWRGNASAARARPTDQGYCASWAGSAGRLGQGLGGTL